MTAQEIQARHLSEYDLARAIENLSAGSIKQDATIEAISAELRKAKSFVQKAALAIFGAVLGAVAKHRWALLAVVFYAVLSSTASADPGEDPLACDASMLDTVAQAIHKTDTDLYLSSCRRDPARTDQWIVSLLSPSAGNTVTDNMWFDVDLVIWNDKQTRVVAHLKQQKAILSDASELRETTVDTGRYTLAEGIRAFGVRDIHYPRCHDCDWSETFLTLYVQRKDKIDRLFSTRVEETTSASGPSSECRDSIHVIRTTIAPGDHTSHGLRDLIVVTRSADEDSSVAHGLPSKLCSTPSIETRVVPYDGTSYGTIEPSRPD